VRARARARVRRQRLGPHGSSLPQYLMTPNPLCRVCVFTSDFKETYIIRKSNKLNAKAIVKYKNTYKIR